MADVKKTLEIMTQTLVQNGLTKVSVSLDDFQIEIEKTPAAITQTILPGNGALAVSGVVNSVSETIEASPEKPCNIVKAPLIGTFYESSAPGKPPFVKVGDRVKRDDVLFIIESMKLMNEVTSEFEGVVTKILPKNADILEYDQPVMVIE
ncbi:MAG: acetyl-CoA carboxylase, biotin carboxyl carrier protein [Ruminococcus sp.]|jgi:acetyl-CoA carboxylase biotin carboxyl carrier protein|nr:acetyl-CoA carboxylase, biotin carboxyl carrier protein [Ruminococcus sp.]